MLFKDDANNYNIVNGMYHSQNLKILERHKSNINSLVSIVTNGSEYVFVSRVYSDDSKKIVYLFNGKAHGKYHAFTFPQVSNSINNCSYTDTIKIETENGLVSSGNGSFLYPEVKEIYFEEIKFCGYFSGSPITSNYYYREHRLARAVHITYAYLIAVAL